MACLILLKFKNRIYRVVQKNVLSLKIQVVNSLRPLRSLLRMIEEIDLDIQNTKFGQKQVTSRDEKGPFF